MQISPNRLCKISTFIKYCGGRTVLFYFSYLLSGVLSYAFPTACFLPEAYTTADAFCMICLISSGVFPAYESSWMMIVHSPFLIVSTTTYTTSLICMHPWLSGFPEFSLSPLFKVVFIGHLTCLFFIFINWHWHSTFSIFVCARFYGFHWQNA